MSAWWLVSRARAVEQPCFADGPGGQALGGQFGQRERVAGVGVDRGEGGGAGGEVVGVAAAEPLPVPLRAPGQHALRADLADDPHQAGVQVSAGGVRHDRKGPMDLLPLRPMSGSTHSTSATSGGTCRSTRAP